jgi:lysophospholipase L1-like esterase
VIYRNYLGFEDRSTGTLPLRFSSRQLAEYGHNPAFETRSRSCAGICIDVMTDSSQLVLEVELVNRVWPNGFFDLFINDRFDRSAEVKHTDTALQDYMFDLSSPSVGLKRITIYLPHNMEFVIHNLIWTEGSRIEAVLPSQKNLLCLGDSITQGMAANHPSNTYPVLLSRQLGMNLLNQGVGGYYYDVNSLDPDLAYTPDIITVAYGTNDWGSRTSTEEMSKHVIAYLQQLTQMYPAVPIFVITPLWRVDWNDIRPMGTFSRMVEIIEEACSLYPTIRCIRGSTLLPHEPNLLLDLVHPTDQAFQIIAAQLKHILSEKN